MRPYMPPPPPNPPPSPFVWGRPERVRELLGDAFELRFEPGTTTLRMPNGESVWELFVAGYGPTKALAASIDPERREQLKRDFITYHERYRNDPRDRHAARLSGYNRLSTIGHKSPTSGRIDCTSQSREIVVHSSSVLTSRHGTNLGKARAPVWAGREPEGMVTDRLYGSISPP